MAPKNPFSQPRPTDSVSKVDAMVSQIYFGAPALLPGEDVAAYDELLANVLAKVEPKDIFEEIWARELVDHIRDRIWWRLLRVRLIQSSLHEGLGKILEPLLEPLLGELNEHFGDPVGDLVKRWARCEPKALKEVKRLLASAGLTMDAVTAQTLALKLDKVEVFDRSIASAEARRNNCLHEIARHRETLGATLRLAVQEAEDAKFVEVRGEEFFELHGGGPFHP